VEEVTKEWVASVIPPRMAWSRKGENGVVMVVGGSRVYHGAPFLTAMAAMRAGVDLVYLFVPEKVAPSIRALSPSLIIYPLSDVKLTTRISKHILGNAPRVDAAAIGPGLAAQRDRALHELLKGLIERGVRLVLDATALQPYVLETVRGKRAVLTPHAGEFARIFGYSPGERIEDRCEAAANAARTHDVIILLKGVVDVITDGERIILNRSGTCAMTVGGTGDVLTGLVAGLLAKGIAPLEAAAAAAYINGLCGEMAEKELGLHILPTDMIERIPLVMREFDRVSS